MTDADRVDRLIRLGFLERHATFLVTVMLHSGVCIQRQYCASARVSHGINTRRFFRDLVTKKYATAYPCARERARLYHVHAKSLYRAIGEPNNRNRRPISLSRAIEGLMLLDLVLAERHLTWLATEDDKVAHFTVTRQVSRDVLPRLIFRNATAETVRFFPDKLPIGVHPDGRTHDFIYVVNRQVPVDFRPYLYRHVALFQAVPKWRVRLLVPPHLQGAATAFHRACLEELGVRLAPATADELRWYFEQRRNATTLDSMEDPERYRRARRTFGGARYRVLFRHWLMVGDSVIAALRSPVVSDAIERGIGEIESYVVTRRYAHLSPLVGTA
jgi:hypothetical protein